MTKRVRRSAQYPLNDALEFLQRLWRVNHTLEKLSSAMERKLGVTAQQRVLVRCVGKYPGIGAGQLATVLHVDPGTVSAALRRLERKGLIERRRSTLDSRRISLGLTRNGRAVDASSEGTVEQIAVELLSASSSQQIAGVTALLERFAVLLDAQVDRMQPRASARPKRA